MANRILENVLLGPTETFVAERVWLWDPFDHYATAPMDDILDLIVEREDVDFEEAKRRIDRAIADDEVVPKLVREQWHLCVDRERRRWLAARQGYGRLTLFCERGPSPRGVTRLKEAGSAERCLSLAADAIGPEVLTFRELLGIDAATALGCVFYRPDDESWFFKERRLHEGIWWARAILSLMKAEGLPRPNVKGLL